MTEDDAAPRDRNGEDSGDEASTADVGSIESVQDPTDANGGGRTANGTGPDADEPPAVLTTEGMAHTLDDYAAFLEGFLEEGYTFRGFEPLPPDERSILVRHDVDFSPERALAMARREAELGVRTTYCFMLTTPAYDLLRHVDVLEEVTALGHDVALHFDTHHYWDERPGDATFETTVHRERATLERIADTTIDVVSFHMPPKWILNRTFEGFQNTYGPAFFGDIGYISDSKGKWRRQPPFEGRPPQKLQVLIHPGLWTPSDRGMRDLLERTAERRRQRIDRYVESF